MTAAIKDHRQESCGLDRAQMSALIKTRALDLGFEKVGIVRVDGLLSEQARLEEWLRRGFHGEMSWMAREPGQRADPRGFFPDTRSIVVVALNYYAPHQHKVIGPSADGQTTGKVSRYAWGDDYHQVVGDKLHSLLASIREQWPEASGKVCVDIQPAMDKAWAARGGLGWIGKHTNLITREFGSWVFLGELLLNLELEYDHEQVGDQCGSCTLCIDACPHRSDC